MKAKRPQFSSTDLKELRAFGVSDKQIQELGRILLYVHAITSTKPKRRETEILLEEIEQLSAVLMRKLGSLVLQPAPEYELAHLMLEDAFWRDPEQQTEGGPTASHRMVPLLAALNKAAKSAREAMPQGQTRQRYANPRAIGWIDQALLDGWLSDQPDPVGTHKPLPPYPKKFVVSKATKGVFRRIAGICYRAAGGNSDPLRAIEAYLAADRIRRREVMAAFEAGIAAGSK